jgi:hypothetical protein
MAGRSDSKLQQPKDQYDEEDHDHDAVFVVVYYFAQIAVLVFGLALNSVVLLMLALNQHLRRKNRFLFNQVLADLSTALIAPIAQILVFQKGVRVSSLHACVFLCCLPVFLTSASLLSVCCLSVNSCLVVLQPHAKVTELRDLIFKVMTAVMWSVSAAIGFVPMGWNREDTFNQNGHRCFYVDVVPIEYNVFVHFFGFILPVLAVIVVLHSLTYRGFLHSSRRVGSAVSANSPEPFKRKERQSAQLPGFSQSYTGTGSFIVAGSRMLQRSKSAEISQSSVNSRPCHSGHSMNSFRSEGSLTGTGFSGWARTRGTLSRTNSLSEESSLKLLKGLVMIVTAYFVSLMPINLLFTWTHFQTLPHGDERYRQLEKMLVFVSQCHAFINPLLYCLRNDSYIQSTWHLLQRKRRRRA